MSSREQLNPFSRTASSSIFPLSAFLSCGSLTLLIRPHTHLDCKLQQVRALAEWTVVNLPRRGDEQLTRQLRKLQRRIHSSMSHPGMGSDGNLRLHAKQNRSQSRVCPCERAPERGVTRPRSKGVRDGLRALSKRLPSLRNRKKMRSRGHPQLLRAVLTATSSSTRLLLDRMQRDESKQSRHRQSDARIFPSTEDVVAESVQRRFILDRCVGHEVRADAQSIRNACRPSSINEVRSLAHPPPLARASRGQARDRRLRGHHRT